MTAYALGRIIGYILVLLLLVGAIYIIYIAASSARRRSKAIEREIRRQGEQYSGMVWLNLIQLSSHPTEVEPIARAEGYSWVESQGQINEIMVLRRWQR